MTPPGGQRRRILGQSKHETKQTNGGKQNSLPVLLLGNNAGTKNAARRRVCWGGSLQKYCYLSAALSLFLSALSLSLSKDSVQSAGRGYKRQRLTICRLTSGRTTCPVGSLSLSLEKGKGKQWTTTPVGITKESEIVCTGSGSAAICSIPKTRK